MNRRQPLRRERPLRAGMPPARRTPLRRPAPLARGVDTQPRPSALLAIRKMQTAPTVAPTNAAMPPSISRLRITVTSQVHDRAQF